MLDLDESADAADGTAVARASTSEDAPGRSDESAAGSSAEPGAQTEGIQL